MATRLPGDLLVLDRDECALFAFCTKEIRDKFRRNGIDSPTLRALLAEVYAVAAGGSATETLPRTPESVAQGQDWVSTKEAADRLQVSQRRVTQMLQEGQLHGQQRSANGSWRISEESVAQYRAERAS